MMSFHSSRTDRRIAFLIVSGWFAVATVAESTSIHFPKFSAPIHHEDRLVVLSPDGTRVLGISLDGVKLWERKHDVRVHLFSGPASEPVLQVGKVVSTISPRSGELRPRFTVESEDDLVTYSVELTSFTSQNRHFHPRMFKLLDAETGQPAWRTSEIEGVICATPELIVCLAVERIPSDQGITFGTASLEAYRRGSFEKKWSVTLPEGSGVPFVPAEFHAPYLIYADGPTSLSVIDCATGLKLLTRQVNLPELGRISALTMIDGRVAWLTSRYNRDNPNNTEYLLHFCTVPELKVERKIVLKLIEIARVNFENGFIISDSISRTACFRSSGEKVWERSQTARSPVINDRIYFSDYHQKTARVGIVEVSTGKQTILYSEPVEEPDLGHLFQLDRIFHLEK